MTLTTNKNLLSGSGLRFTLQRAPNLVYFCQSANIPGVSISRIDVPNQLSPTPFAGDSVTFSELSLTFAVSENLDNFKEIFDWIIGLGFPNTTEEYKNLVLSGQTTGSGLYSDGTLTILNSALSGSIDITFRDMFPLTLSDITLETTKTDIEYMTCTASFAYHSYKISNSQ